MTWMTPGAAGHTGHNAAAAVKPGMATQDDLDVLFLQLMIRHHQGGAPMLTDAATHATLPAVRHLAGQMGYHQNEESAALLQQLAAHHAQPIT